MKHVLGFSDSFVSCYKDDMAFFQIEFHVQIYVPSRHANRLYDVYKRFFRRKTFGMSQQELRHYMAQATELV